VIPSFEDLRHQTADADFAPLYHRLEGLSDFEPDAVVDDDALNPSPPKSPLTDERQSLFGSVRQTSGNPHK
jgi:hypothetical protein